MNFDSAILTAYLTVLGLLSVYGLHRYWIVYLYWRYHKRGPVRATPAAPGLWPRVTVQLPLYNEYYVAERLIDSVCALDYPKDRLEIQVLDDSTDDTRAVAAAKVREKQVQGFHISHIQRRERQGFKAGALAHGLVQASGELIAIFDADFLPPADFLRRTVPWFADANIGLVQTRWGHLNAGYSLLTRVQSLCLDAHFMLEHTARNRSGAFINFNGTAGVWRRTAIEAAGGWQDDTLTEDLDLSYRAQLAGWKFLFLPDVVCPAELPVRVKDFRSQQHRWTQGTFQVAQKTLPKLWRSAAPLRAKIEGTLHLTAGLAFPLVLLLSLLLLPSLAARSAVDWTGLKWVELGAFLLTVCSNSVYFALARRECGQRGARWAWRDLPALMALGIGLCLNNTRALAEACLKRPHVFRRTAKFNIAGRKNPWPAGLYRLAGGPSGVPETVFAGYSLVAMIWSLKAAFWTSLPLLSLFVFGYTYIGALSLAQTVQESGS
jgi:glycosyltransferase involved in cell wall biosynthesis